MNEKEAYVKIVGKARTLDYPDTYCPVHVSADGTQREILLGLSLIGFVPDGAEIVGELNEDTDKLTFYKKPKFLTNNKSSPETATSKSVTAGSSESSSAGSRRRDNSSLVDETMKEKPK